MRAVGVTEYGGPEILHQIELPDPHPGPRQVRIRTHAAAVNPVDVNLRTGKLTAMFGDLQPPFVPGMDLSGVIDEVGEEVTAWQVGDEVISVVDHRATRGAYSELLVVSQDSVVRKPAGMEFSTAASFLMNSLTARLALDALGLPTGAALGVTGGSGAVGGFAVQLAVGDGLRVIADAVADERDLVQGLGASEIVLRIPGQLPDYRSLRPDGLEALVDGAGLGEQIVPSLRQGGGLAVFRAWEGAPPSGVRVEQINVRTSVEDGPALARLVAQAEQGVITPRVSAIFPADDVVEAHRLMDAGGGVGGRIVLEFT